jgi:hypothetical protein
MINKTMGRPIEMIAEIAIKTIEKTETCILLPPVYFYHVILFMSMFFEQIFPKNLAGISHNVPAVYDVFASPIKETVGFQGLQKCGWSGAWEA